MIGYTLGQPTMNIRTMQLVNQDDESAFLKGPFNLKEEDAYEKWRSDKLLSAPRDVMELIVPITGLSTATDYEVTKILALYRRANMAIYTCRDKFIDPEALRGFGALFGLKHVDHHLCASEHGVARLSSTGEGPERLYAPYSNRSLSWHTDGYYNAPNKHVRTVILHCAAPAAAPPDTGGENALLDPELAYIHLRDESRDFITALMHPDCLTIPANQISDDDIRPARSGPVFSINPVNGRLHMRFTARKRHVIWRDDATTRAAVDCLLEMLNDPAGPALRYRLGPGEGLISNNVLHNRTAFDDDPTAPRLLYRARFNDEIGN